MPKAKYVGAWVWIIAGVGDVVVVVVVIIVDLILFRQSIKQE